MTRRRILATGIAGVASALGTRAAFSQMLSTTSRYQDYRSLVCVFLYGGNDAFNMLVPRSDLEYRTYAVARQNLSIPREQLLPLSPIDSNRSEYGLHPAMPAFQRLFEHGVLALVTGIGPLLEPTTKEQYENGTARLPPQLFSHDDQQTQWQSLRAGRSSGWGGRMADLLAATETDQLIPTNVSTSGSALFGTGDNTAAYVIDRSGPLVVAGLDPGRRRSVYERVLDVRYQSIYARTFSAIHRRALSTTDRVTAALNSAPPITTAFPDTPLGEQLSTVARLISVRHELNMRRQIFFVAMGGFDTHDNQLLAQPRLFADLSSSIAAFYDATRELGVSDSVTTFTQSEFGRTLTSNGDGTDHGWAGVQVVVGDAVLGRRIYGDFPSLQLRGPNDIGSGRIIPSVSVDQYAATLSRWFGVTDDELVHVVPNITNFPAADLGFLR